MNKKQISINALLKLVGFYSLIVGIIGAILIFGFIFSKQQNHPSPTPTISPTTTTSSSPTQTENQTEGKFCGGIAAIRCPEGYTCQLSGNYPDAGGKCIKK